MGTWQLYVDETGQFGSSHDALAVGGWLYRGYASDQLATALRRVIDRIFVGVAYPPHAAHHNCASTLLYAPLRGAPLDSFPTRYATRIHPALALARGATSPEAVRLREAVASDPRMHTIELDVWRAFDRWLAKTAADVHAALYSEADAQRADFTNFLETELTGSLATRAHLLVGAWKPRGTSELDVDPKGDADYVELFETVLERALAFVTSSDEDARLFVHVAKRPWSKQSSGPWQLSAAQSFALGHPLLKRATKPPFVMEPCVVPIDDRAHAGFVVADFIANRLRRTLDPWRSWPDVAASAEAMTGLAAVGTSSLVRTGEKLPALTGAGHDRMALKSAAQGEPVALKLGPLWCREQAALWVSAIEEGP